MTATYLTDAQGNKSMMRLVVLMCTVVGTIGFGCGIAQTWMLIPTGIQLCNISTALMGAGMALKGGQTYVESKMVG